jgi:hypothetical protein
MYLLRKITNPDGTLKHPVNYFTEFLPFHYANPEKLKAFTKSVYRRFMENYPMDVGLIEQTNREFPTNYLFTPGVSHVDENPTFTIDTNIAIEPEETQELQQFYNFHQMFFCHFLSKTEEQGTHAFILKKETEGATEKLILLDPHGMEMGDDQSVFTSSQLDSLRKFFPGIPIEPSPCELQGKYAVCNLWAILFLSFRGKSHFEIFKMFANTAGLLGYNPIAYDQSVNDIILIAIFEEFMAHGFADAATIGQYPEGQYLQGLGKCRKCGGTKKSGYVQRLIAEGKLDASKVSNPSKFVINLGKANRKRIDAKTSTKKHEMKWYEHKYWTDGRFEYELMPGIQKGNKRKSPSKETIEKIRMSNTGKKLSKDTKEKISKSQIGRIPGNKGIKHSEETITKMKLAWTKRSRVITQEYRDKLSKANKGKVLAKDKQGKVYYVYKTDPRWLSGELVGIAKKTFNYNTNS